MFSSDELTVELIDSVEEFETLELELELSELRTELETLEEFELETMLEEEIARLD